MKDLDQLVAEICQIARRRKWRLGTAESCTGGQIAKAITDVAGVSDVFFGGVVTYSNAFKERLLGVGAETLTRMGAVSTQTAREMVSGLASRFQLELGIAVTGIAGPTGGTIAKPVGLVYIATIVLADIEVTENRFAADRTGIRNESVRTALNQLRNHMGRHAAEP